MGEILAASDNGSSGKGRVYAFFKRMTNALLNKYLFFSVFFVSVLPAFFKHDRLFSGVFPEPMNALMTLLAHIMLCLFFSILAKFIISNSSAENKERGFLVVLSFLISCVLNVPELPFFDSLALYIIFFVFCIIRINKVGILIPVLLLFTFLICPILILPAIPYALYLFIETKKLFPKKETQRKVRALIISSAASAVIAAALNFVLNKDLSWLTGIFVPQFSQADNMINDVSKLGIFLSVFSVSIFCSWTHSKCLKHTVIIGSICTYVIFLLNYQNNMILFESLVFQGLIMLFISRRSIDSYIRDTSKKKKIALMIIALIIISEQLIFTIDYDDHFFGLSTFVITPFYVNYQDIGFIQRGFFGTVYRLILGNYIPSELFYTVFFTSFILFKIIFVLLIVKTIHNPKYKTEHTISIILVFAFLCSPGLNKYYFEMFNFILAWLCVLLAYRNKRTMLFIPLLCMIAMMIHQIFASIIFPIVFIVIVYRAFIDSQGHTVRNMIVCFATLFVVGAGFLYLTFFNSRNIDLTYEQMCDIINNASGGFFQPHYEIIKYVYLDNANEHVKVFTGTVDGGQIFSAFKVYLLNIPGFAIYLYAFLNSAAKSKTRVKKIAYIICCLSILAILPAFIIETDYGRWCSQYISIILLAPFALAMFQSEENKWYNDVSKKKMCIVLALLLLGVFLQNSNFNGMLTYYYPKFL